MAKKLIFCFLFFLLSACSVPSVPKQPENGIITNYRSKNQRMKAKNFTSSKVNYDNDGTISIANLPFLKQGKDNTCGQATMTSVLNYWGVDISYQQVVNETNPGNFPTDPLVIKDYLTKKGLLVNGYKKGEIEFIKELIRDGQPVIVLLDFGGLKYEHYVVISGYNDKRGFILIADPVNGPNIKIEEKVFYDLWKNQSLLNLLIFGDQFERLFFAISGY